MASESAPDGAPTSTTTDPGSGGIPVPSPDTAAPADAQDWPDVSVVIATRDRIELLRKAVDAALAQDYPGAIEVVVVFDRSEPVQELHRSDAKRRVRVIVNDRSPGLAGARNSGILAAAGDLVAFCDDDDFWLPHKLRVQVEAMRRLNGVGAVAGIEIHYGDKVRYRVPETDRITVEALSRSRVTGAHPSTYVFRRNLFLGNVGLVDEQLPHGYGEDYDVLMRMARAGTIAMVQLPLVVVLWHKGSYFSRRWEAMAEGVGYLLEKHPELGADPRGRAWIEGQRAFALAALGQRREAVRGARRALKANPREPRGVLALLVAARVLPAHTVMNVLNARGRGI
ncbi:MAG: glycosyltransferase [Actinomycetota bacterium]|nr:glycosyltransferase [Actinomycetota bacterium]